MYSSKVIANYFIYKSFDEGISLTPMKLLKLVYLSHGWFMAYNNRPLISEPVLAWDYGPVIKSLYHAIKKFGKRDVTEYIDINNDYEITDEDFPPVEIRDFLDIVWETYKNDDGLYLSSLTHMEGSPWSQTYNNRRGRNNIIPNNVIQSYYLKKAN